MIKRRISLLLCFVLAALCTAAFTTDTASQSAATGMTTEAHVYEIGPGTEEWSSFTSRQQRWEACYVAPEELAQMTTPALVETILTYPLLVDMFCFDDLETGIKAVSADFSGLNELFTREDAVEVLLQYSVPVSEWTEDMGTQCLYADALLNYLYDLSTAQTPMEDTDSVSMSLSSVKTPAGSSVLAYYQRSWDDVGTTAEAVAALDQEALSTYTSAKIISGPNPSYNCHSYAWYSQEVTNEYWIPNPTLYMTDGSYTDCTAFVGCVVFYNSKDDSFDHSGIMTALSSGLTSATVTSKWGSRSVFSHYTNDCPYTDRSLNTSSVTVGCWKLAS